VYLQENAAMAPIFAQWIEPLKDLGVTTITLRNTGGTDHEAFDAVGIPGFQFIQDPLDYESRTHHSNMDVYEELSPGDLAQAAVVEAIFVYNTAMRDQMLPRKPLPHPELEEQLKAPLRNIMPVLLIHKSLQLGIKIPVSNSADASSRRRPWRIRPNEDDKRAN
jgi:carboxypeptidase Q